MIDAQRQCHGFGRIRPCLLWQGRGWWIGPQLADSPKLAQRLVRGLLQSNRGVVLLDGPGADAALAGAGFLPKIRGRCGWLKKLWSRLS